MSANSKIQWTDRTWNPVRGCSIVSPGCVNCYAMKQAHRFSGEGRAYEGLTKQTSAGPQWTGRVREVADALNEPLKWKKPERIFVNSMSDLFHEGVSFEFVDRVFAVMASSHRHRFQILTKRPDRMRAYMQRVSNGAAAAAERYEREMREHFDKYKMEFREGYSIPEPPTPELRFIYDSAATQEQRPTNPNGEVTCDRAGFSGGEYHWNRWPLRNVWLGVSAENQSTADNRIDDLLNTPAAVRFMSCEPLLGPIDMFAFLKTEKRDECLKALKNGGSPEPGIDWVIVGGESGHGARPCDIEWIRSIKAQCESASVPVFVKQLGANSTFNGVACVPYVDRKGGDILEWPSDLQVRQFPGDAR